MIVLLLAWVATASPPAIVSIQAEDQNGRSVLGIASDADLGPVEVQRENDRLLVRFEIDPAGGLTIPPPAPPIRALRMIKESRGVALAVDLDPGVVHAIERKGNTLSIILGRRSIGIGPPTAEELYRLLFPSPPGRPTAEVAVVAQAGAPGEEGVGGAVGIPLGPLNLRPALTLGYVNADIVMGDPPAPRRDDYYEIQPRLGVESVASLGIARLSAEYTPRFRAGSEYEITRRPTHLVNAAIDWPAASRLEVHVKGHYARGTLETEEVDPGREYFYRLGRFERDEISVSAQFEVAPRFGLEAGGGVGHVRFEEESSFFGYDRQSAHIALLHELSPRTRLSVGYHVLRTPPVDSRPEAESMEQSGQLRIDGDLAPLVKGFMSLGYARRDNPEAPADGRRYRGLVASMGVTKAFTPSASIRLTANRATHLSAFENNGFYISTSGTAELALPLPMAFALRGGTGYHVNVYRTPASETGVPRKDRLFGWSVGLGRPIGRAAYLRADYRWDRRDSNVDSFDHDTQALLIQLGIGYFDAPEY